jgi:hypothetical protein
MRISIWLVAAVLAAPALASAQGNRGPAAPVQVKTTLLGGSVYGIDGQGGRMAALVGPEGVLLVDAQSPAVTDSIVAALKGNLIGSVALSREHTRSRRSHREETRTSRSLA